MRSDEIGRLVDRVREEAPLVHNVTNAVAVNWSANILIAVGASPIMALAPEEAGELAAAAGALVVNMGTLTEGWVDGAGAAVRGARGAGKPWLLDPVGVGATSFRRRIGARMLEAGPTIVRGNASEIVALAGAAGGGKGVDSTLGSEAARAAAGELAGRGPTIVATGAVDLVTDGRRSVEILNGHPLLTRITASGCGLSALTGAFLAVERDPVRASVAGLVAYGVAAEIAAERATGPGSFMVALLDTLNALEGRTVADRARVR